MPRPAPTEAELVARHGEVVARYNSTRNVANVYDVRRKEDGTLWCSCPGHHFRKTCRHVERVAQGLDDDSALLERQERTRVVVQALRAANLGLVGAGRSGLPGADETRLYTINTWPHGGDSEARAAERLLVALEALGALAPRPERAQAPSGVRPRSFRVITLED